MAVFIPHHQMRTNFEGIVCDKHRTPMVRFNTPIFDSQVLVYACIEEEYHRMFVDSVNKPSGYMDHGPSMANILRKPTCPKDQHQKMYLQPTSDWFQWVCPRCGSTLPYDIEMTDEEIEFEILRTLSNDADADHAGFMHYEAIRSATSLCHAAHHRKRFVQLIGSLKLRQQIEIAYGDKARISPMGAERFRMGDEKYRREYGSNHGSSVHIHDVDNVTMSMGPNSPVVQNVHILNESDKTASLELIDKIVSELQKHSGMEDAINEAEQLKLEVKRKEPRLDRILGTLKTLAEIGKTAVALMPYLHSLAAHLHIADKLPFLS